MQSPYGFKRELYVYIQCVAVWHALVQSSLSDDVDHPILSSGLWATFNGHIIIHQLIVTNGINVLINVESVKFTEILP